MRKSIFTIGHSTHSTREFIQILKSFEIDCLVDVRHYPGSKFCPQFSKARLKASLKRHKIQYIHLEALGGRRTPKKSEENAAWRNRGFRGYADYMQNKDFKDGLQELIDLSKKSKVVIMCAEAVPWRCHRSLIGDALLVRNFKVHDIFNLGKSKDHKLTPFAKISGKKITYPPEVTNEPPTGT